MRSRDGGSATVWMVSCCALLTVVASVVTIRGLAVLARHRAEVGADLAALAAAGRIGVGADECAVAARVARENRVRLRSCRVHLAPDGRSGTVAVRVVIAARLPVVGVGHVTATARAAREPGPARDRKRFAAATPAAARGTVASHPRPTARSRPHGRGNIAPPFERLYKFIR
jgi:secretion/DNA translocation related TadE-like protein